MLSEYGGVLDKRYPVGHQHLPPLARKLRADLVKLLQSHDAHYGSAVRQ
jgi:hypothetical protein